MNYLWKLNHELTFWSNQWTSFSICRWDWIISKQKVVVSVQKILRRKWLELTVRCATFPIVSAWLHVTIWSLWQVIESMPIKSWATLVTLWSNNLVVSCLSWRKHETDFRTFSTFGCNSNWVISSASNSIWILWITHWWIRITSSNTRYILAKSKYGMFQQVLDRDLVKIYSR